MKNAPNQLFKQTLIVVLCGLSACLLAQPANDNCPNAILLTSSTTCSPVVGTTTNATQSLPDCNSGSNANDDVWYKFVATSNMHTVTVGSASLDMVVNVRTGPTCPGSDFYCFNDAGAGETESYSFIGLTAGTTYFIRVFTVGNSTGSFNICVTHPAPPANDNCSGAITLTPGASCTNTSGTTAGATNSIAACGGFGTADHDVWYKFTATAPAHRIVASSTTLDLVVNPRSGNCNGAGLGCFNNAGLGGTETVDLTGLTIGATYFIRVYTMETNVFGSFDICVTNVPAPANNECSGAIQLTSSTSCSNTAGTTIGATQSAPACGGFGSADDDVWYKFTATSYTHTITASSATLDMVVETVTGSCTGASLNCTNNAGDGIAETATLTNLTLGATYYVRVYSAENGVQGAFNICITHPNTIPNDECSGAILLTSSVNCVTTTGITNGATQSLPACTAGNNADDDVWYKFVATSTEHTVEVINVGSFVALDVRSGSCNGASIACKSVPFSSVDGTNTQTANLTNLTIGATYYARVYSQQSDFITFTICVTQPPPPANNDCANAATLSVSSNTCIATAGTTSFATQSLAACGSGTADDDVWYKFVATATTHKISVFSDGLDFIFDLRSGACNGTSIACVNNAGDGGTESITQANLTIGSTYYVRVYTVGSTSGSFSICVGPPAPANDDCTGAILLTSSETCVNTSGTTTGATQSMTDCSGGTSSNDDVWYKFVAVSPNHTVTAYSATLNLTLNVRSGACDGTNLSCSASGGIGEAETLNFTNLTVGATYYARVFTQGTTTFGSFVICVTHIPGPANDDCANAILLTPSATCVPTSGTTQNATSSLPDCAGGNNSDDDVWYKFVAVSTTHIVTVASPTLNMILDVRSGSCNGTSLNCINTGGVGVTESYTMNNLTPGATYYARVFTQGTTTFGTFMICVTTPPVNDDCTGAIVLTSSNACNPITGNTAGATESTSGCAITTANELWYQFVAVSTSHTITVSSATLDLVFNMRFGSCAGSATSCINSTGVGGTETATYNSLTVGTSYFIRIFSADPAVTGTFSICVTHPPANDDCAGALLLTSGTSCVNTNGSTAGATQSVSACATTTANDVWYQFVAVSPNQTVTVSSATMDMVVNVRPGGCTNGSFGCTNSTGVGGTETVTFNSLTVGATYYIRVFGDNPAITGPFTICVTHIPIPANDDCAGAIVLTPGITCTPVTGVTTAATQSLTDCSGGNDSDDDIWYRFVATSAAHTVTATPAGPNFDIAMDIRSGACNGSSIVCQNATAGGASEVYTLTNLTIGATYYVRVYGINGRGSITICVTTPPANDECSGAQLLTSGTSCAATNGSTESATQSLPACGSGNVADDDVWYRFVAVYPVHTVTVSSATLNLEMNVRAGACPGTDLACVNAFGSGGTETTTLTGLTVGATYYVRVYTIGTNTGTFTICVTHPPTPANDECANAVSLTSSPTCTTTAGTTSGATQSLAACVGTGAADDDVWYKFTALSTSHTVTVSSPDINVVINVRSGACNGTDLGCYNTNTGAGAETANLTGLTVGQTYLIRVYSFSSSLGAFTICVTHQLPANDECTGAVNLTPVAGVFTDPGMQSNALATQTTTGAFCPGSFSASTVVEDVWYKFTTNATGGTINISATPMNGTGNPLVHFFAGCNVGPVTCNDQGGAGATETLTIPGLSANTAYYFRVYGQNSPAFPFTISLSGSAVNSALPLELASFNGRAEEHSNLLSWTTLSEKNVQFHIVEFAVNGTDWMELGRLAGRLDSHEPISYTLEDRNPPARSYYRLRSVDYDGAVNLSPAILLTRENEAFGVLHLFPSPVHDHLTVQCNMPKEESVLLQVINMAGQLVSEQRLDFASGLNEFRMNLSPLPAGLYFLQLRTERQAAVSRRFMKE